MAKAERKGPQVQTDEFTDKEQKQAELQTPAEFAVNKNWKAYRKDIDGLLKSSLGNYLSRYKAIYRSGTTEPQSETNISSLNYKV